MYPRPTEVRYAGDYRLLVTFEDGVCAELDFSPLTHQAGVFGELQDREVFRHASIDTEAETLAWPNGADICPDVLYHLATGAALPGPLPYPPASLVRSQRVTLPMGT